MTTENEDTQYHLQYTSLVEIRSSILSLTFEIKESRAIPQDVSIDDHVALALFIDDINCDLGRATRANRKVMDDCSIELSIATNFHIINHETDITIGYSRKETTKKISRSLSIGARRKEWDEPILKVA